MNDECLYQSKILWEKMDIHEDNHDDLGDCDDIDIYIPRYKQNSNWVSPNIGRLPIPLYNIMKSKVWSMDFTKKRRNPISQNVNTMFFCVATNMC